jgi:hypothetical protein
MTITGRCECSSITFRVDADPADVRDVFDCHCGRCRRFTGHHMAATSVPTELVTIHDEGTLTWFSPHATVQYGFCNHCGSSLFWRAVAHPERVSITAGSIDQPTGMRTTAAWWMAEHGDYHTPQSDVIQYSHDG